MIVFVYWSTCWEANNGVTLMCWQQKSNQYYEMNERLLSRKRALKESTRWSGWWPGARRRISFDCLFKKRPLFTVIAKSSLSFSLFSDQYESVTERISKAGWMKTSQQIQISLQSPNSPGYPHSFPLRSRRRSLSKSTSQATTAAWSLQCETLWVTADSIDPLQESQSWLSGANRGSHFWLIPPLDA